jgi:ribosomal protein L7Ae-like RNA K-turn-binding protein
MASSSLILNGAQRAYTHFILMCQNIDLNKIVTKLEKLCDQYNEDEDVKIAGKQNKLK